MRFSLNTLTKRRAECILENDSYMYVVSIHKTLVTVAYYYAVVFQRDTSGLFVFVFVLRETSFDFILYF